jgi:acyl-CoA thioesterase FadM
MENIEIIEVPNSAGELVKHVIIDRGNGEFTSMPKSVWDELEAAKEASGTLS